MERGTVRNMNNFVTAWETLFGVYSPIPILDIEGNIIEYVTDWGYVSRVAFFIIVTFCILKLLGGVLKRDSRR